MEQIRIVNGVALLDGKVSARIADFEKKIKALKDAEEELKKGILYEMESKGIVKVETDDLVLTYVAPTTRESFDSKRFRNDCPDVYDDYVKIAPVKASVRIKVK